MGQQLKSDVSRFVLEQKPTHPISIIKGGLSGLRQLICLAEIGRPTPNIAFSSNIASRRML